MPTHKGHKGKMPKGMPPKGMPMHERTIIKKGKKK